MNNGGMFHHPRVSSLRKLFYAMMLFAMLFTLFQPQLNVQAAASFTVTPISWNVVGLDSNNVNAGPNAFPVAARVCNISGSPQTNVQAQFVWDSANPYINLRAGSLTTLSVPTLSSTAGANCTDFYFEVMVTRTSAALNQARAYHIAVTSTQSPVATNSPSPREIYVERLVSQNRNSIEDVQLNGVSIPAGGAMSLMVGNTYTIKLVGLTASGYNQLESFINISNMYVRINSVKSTYTLASLSPSSSSLLYADSCGWDNDPTSPTYRSCIVSDGKSGGTVNVEYNVTILSGYGLNQQLYSMFYDFSGSSYHYNADFASKARTVSIVTPMAIAKSFPAKSVAAGVTTPLEISLTNLGPADATSVTLVDPLPAIAASQMTVAATPGVTLSAPGCLPGSTLTAPAGASSIIFTGGVKGLSTCTIHLNVAVPAAPLSGSYANTTGHLIVNGQDTNQSASANLTVAAASAGIQICTSPTLATWTVSTATNPPTAATLNAGITAAALAGAGVATLVDTATGSWRINDYNAKTTTFDPALNEYVQFAATTTGYTNITFQFDAQINGNRGPRSLYLYSSTDGANFTPYGTVIAPTAAWVTYSQPFTGTSNANGQTYFRIYGYDPGNPGNADYLYLDNIVIGGSSCYTPTPPTLSKTFGPAVIKEGGLSTLTFTLTNPNSVPLTSATFTDALPTGLTVSGTPATPQCSGTVTKSADSTSVTLANATIPANGSCQVNVSVTGLSAGAYNNTTGFISAYESGTNTNPVTGSAAATLHIAASPVVAQVFSPNPVYVNATSKLTFTVQNTNAVSLPGVGFTDTLAGALVVANPAGTVTSDCSADGATPIVTAVAGSKTIQLQNAAVSAGKICTVTVNVSSPTTGSFSSTTSAFVSGISGLTASPASDSLTVIAHTPAIDITKQVSLSADGPWASFLNTAPLSPVYYRLKIENTGDVPLSNLSVSDPQVSLAACIWPATLPNATPTQDPTATCVVGPITGLASGTFTNTASASGTYGGTTYSDTSSATYAISNLITSLSSAPGYFSAAGDVLTYTFVISNTGTPLAGPVVVNNSNALVTCPAITSIGNGDAFLGPYLSGGVTVYESLTCTATYTVTEADVLTGSISSSAYTVISGVRSNIDRETVYANKADLTVTKTNNIGGYGLTGTHAHWTLQVENVGPVAADFAALSTLLSDPLPVGASYAILPGSLTSSGVSGTGAIQCAIASDTLTCTANGGSVIIGANTGSFSITIDATLTNSGNLANTATVDPAGAVIESNESNNTGTDVLYIISSVPAISLSVSASPATYSSAGSLITYSYTITNTGNTVLAGPFSISDSIASTTCDSVPVSGLYPSATLNCSGSYTIRQADVDGGQVTNSATATGNGVTSKPAGDTVTAVQNPLILMSVSSTTPAITAAGQVVPYTLTVTNPGNLSLPDISVSADFCSAAPVYSAGDTDADSMLDVTETWVYTCSHTVTQAEIDAGGSLSTSASADSSLTDPSTSTGFNIPITQVRALGLTSQVTPASFDSVGDVLNYTFTVENTGNVTQTGADLSVPGLTLTCTPAQPADLAPGASMVCTASHTITQDDLDAGSTVFVPDVTTATPGTTILNDGASVSITGVQTPELTVTQSVTETSFNAVGDLLHYTYVIDNTGNVTLDGTAIDVPGLTLSCIPAQPASLAPGETMTCTGIYTVTQDDLDAGGVTLAPAVSSDNGGTSVVITGGTSTISADKNPELTVTQSATETTFDAIGDVLHYSFVIDNTGNVTQTGAAIDVPGLSLTCDPEQPADLAPGAAMTCTATHTVTQGDLDAGSLSFIPAASSTIPNTSIVSTNANLTINADQNPELTITQTVEETTFNAVGDLLHYTFTLDNTGNITLEGTTFSVPGLVLTCDPQPPLDLAPGAVVTCTGIYTITQDDLDAGGVTLEPVVSTDVGNTPVVINAGTTTISANQTPELTVTQTATETSFNAAGDVLNYTFTLDNTGNVTLDGVGLNVPGLTITCDPEQPADLAPGQSMICTGSYTVTQADLDAGGVSFAPVASSNTPDTTVITTGADLTITADQNPELTITQSVTETSFNAVGDLLHYTYLLDNTGNVTLDGVTLSVPGLVLTCDPAQPLTLAPGETATCTGIYTVTQDDLDHGSVTLQPVVSTSAGSIPVTLAGGPIIINASQSSEMTVTQTAQETSFNAVGDVLHYSFVIDNTGNVTLDNAAINVPGLTITCDPEQPSDLAPGQSMTCTGSYTVTQGDLDNGSVAFDPIVSTSTPDTTVITDNASLIISAEQNPELTVTQTVEETAYSLVGDVLHYTVTVDNTGNITLDGVFIDVNGLTLTCDPEQPANLAPGETMTCTGTYTITQDDLDAGSLAFIPTVTSQNGSPDVIIASGETILDAERNGELTLVQSAQTATYSAVGDLISYQYEITNSGNLTLSGVAIGDTSGLSDLVCDPEQPTTLAPGQTMTCTASYTVTQADLDAGTIVNTITASTTTPGTAIITEQASLTITAQQTTDLVLALTASPATYNAVGDSITYSYEISNHSNITLNGPFTISDSLISVECPNTASLAPNQMLTCSASYTIQQADLDAGSIGSSASAASGGTTSNTVQAKVNAVQTPGLTVTESAAEPTFSYSGDVLHVSITVENSGNVTLSGAAISNDGALNGFTCDLTQPAILAPGAAMTCTGTHTVTFADWAATQYTHQVTAVATPPSGSPFSASAESLTPRLLRQVFLAAVHH